MSLVRFLIYLIRAFIYIYIYKAEACGRMLLGLNVSRILDS